MSRLLNWAKNQSPRTKVNAGIAAAIWMLFAGAELVAKYTDQDLEPVGLPRWAEALMVQGLHIVGAGIEAGIQYACRKRTQVDYTQLTEDKKEHKSQISSNSSMLLSKRDLTTQNGIASGTITGYNFSQRINAMILCLSTILPTNNNTEAKIDGNEQLKIGVGIRLYLNTADSILVGVTKDLRNELLLALRRLSATIIANKAVIIDKSTHLNTLASNPGFSLDNVFTAIDTKGIAVDFQSLLAGGIISPVAWHTMELTQLMTQGPSSGNNKPNISTSLLKEQKTSTTTKLTALKAAADTWMKGKLDTHSQGLSLALHPLVVDLEVAINKMAASINDEAAVKKALGKNFLYQNKAIKLNSKLERTFSQAGHSPGTFSPQDPKSEGKEDGDDSTDSNASRSSTPTLGSDDGDIV